MPDILEKFYDELQTLPKLIGDLALSVAEAQRRLDQNYLDGLAAVSKVAATVTENNPDPDTFLKLLSAMVPPRYQFTETICEVRADLQMASSSELSAGGSLGLTVPFAVSVNASYTRRSAYDYNASALIRTVLQPAPAYEALNDKLLKRAAELPASQLPDAGRFAGFINTLNQMKPKQEEPAEK